MFHKLIESEDRERLSQIIEIIQNCLESARYSPATHPSESILTDGIGTPIKAMKIFVNKEAINYRIEIQILES